MQDYPLVTIITVVFNGKRTLEETIISVINQSYKNMEYIIIDGNSTDGTLDIIKKYEEKIHYWVSEPDKGIYNAMNKGIDRANGEWINFMNSGDKFYSTTTLQEVFEKNNTPESDIIYGDALLIYDFGSYVKKARPLETMLTQLPFSHQASFVKSRLIKAIKFDESYISSGDYQFFYNSYLSKHIFFYVSIVIAEYYAEQGISSNFRLVQREDGKIKGLDKKPGFKIILGVNYMIYLFKLIFKKNLPRNLVTKLRRWKNK